MLTLALISPLGSEAGKASDERGELRDGRDGRMGERRLHNGDSGIRCGRRRSVMSTERESEVKARKAR